MAGRFRKFLVASLVVLFTAGLGPVGARADTDPIAFLRGQILKALTGSTAHLQGFYVSLSGLRGGAQLNAGVPLVPASNEKVFTGLAALLQLTPDLQLVTVVRRTGPVSGGVLSGDLVLQGVGDPLLSQYALNAMARRVADAGVRRVTGSLWAYDGRYDRLRTAPGWKPYTVPDDIGPLSALAVGENAWRKDPAFIRDPATANANWFRSMLAKFGVRVVGPTRLGRPHAYASVLTGHPSQTTRSLVRRMLKVSDNFVAEELLKEVGTRPHVQGTTAGGISVLWQWAAKLGLSAGQAYDGSGLSWWDRVTPRYEVRWLRAAERSSVGADFVASLPIGCVDGTLKDRFCHTPAAGKVFAKTGTLSSVVSLAGYTTTASGRHVRFSFILNHVDSILSAREAIDRAVIAIVRFAA